MVNIAMFLASEKGYNSLRTAIDSGLAPRIKFVSTFKETNVTKSFDEDICNLCDQYHIKHFTWSDLKPNLLNTVENMCVGIAFTVSWKFLIDTRINQLMKYGLVVFMIPFFQNIVASLQPRQQLCAEKVK